MKISQEKLNEIIKSHGKWLNNENGGIKANLISTDLRSCNLRYANLRYANLNSSKLSSCDLSSCDLSYANLRCADLSCADLSWSNLNYADLHCADLNYANLRGVNLSYANTDKRYLQIACIGSKKECLTYCFEDDLILCGCFNNYKGGTLKEFEEQINLIYGNKSLEKEKKYFNEYIGAINYIKFLRGK